MTTTTAPAPDPDDIGLTAWREAGTALGMLKGHRAVQRARENAEDCAFKDAFDEAMHAQIEAAGLCICAPDLAEQAADIPVYTVTGVDGVAEAIRQIFETAHEKVKVAFAEAAQDGSTEPVEVEDGEEEDEEEDGVVPGSPLAEVAAHRGMLLAEAHRLRPLRDGLGDAY